MENYLDFAPCYFFSTSGDGIILQVNNTLCAALGYTKEELTGQKVDTIFTLATRIFHQTHFFPLLKMQGFTEEIFISLLTKDKKHIPVLLNAERKYIDNQEMLLHVGILVNNRKKFEDELIGSKKAAENALNENTVLAEAKQALQKNMELMDQQMMLIHQQNEELKQFNRVATHDLQEPLRKLSVFSNMLLTADPELPEHKKIVERLIGVSEQMRGIVAGLQQYLWLTEHHNRFTEIHFKDILSPVVHNLEREFPGNELHIISEELPIFQADWNQMEMLFYQLLHNACRFRKDEHRTTVHISATNLLLNQFRNLEGKYKYANFLKIDIRDEGIGFDEVYKDQVFGMFKRLHTESGQGIGLSLCKRIIENHDGEIAISSKPGEGTIVTIFLPAHIEA